MKAPRIAIIGGGASGIIAALNCVDVLGRNAEIVIFEPADELGAGLAYSTDESSHLLNVPAGGMSYSEQKPDDFSSWLEENFPAAKQNRHFPFVPRFCYRKYLQKRLHDAIAGGACIGWKKEKVAEVKRVDLEWQLQTETGAAQSFAYCFVATGYRKTPDFSVLGDLDGGAHPKILSPYAPFDRAWLSQAKTVGIIGAGLTAIDVWLRIRAYGFQGRVQFFSRRGIFPLPHVDAGSSTDIPNFSALAGESPLKIYRFLRELASSGTQSWQSIAIHLRPHVGQIWRAWSDKQKRQFHAHLQSYWEPVRHRMPASIHAELMKEINAGTANIRRARIGRTSRVGEQLQLSLKECDQEWLKFDGIFLATRTFVEKAPFAGFYFIANSQFHLIGPVGKMIHWEVTAVPEIRRQARDAAMTVLHESERLSAFHEAAAVEKSG